jgi:hypothetical protein
LKADHKTENGYPKAQHFPRLSHSAFASAIIEYGIIAELRSIRLMPLPFRPASVPDRATNTSILPLLSILATAMTHRLRGPKKKKEGLRNPLFRLDFFRVPVFRRTNLDEAEIRKYRAAQRRPDLFDTSPPQPWRNGGSSSRIITRFRSLPN